MMPGSVTIQEAAKDPLISMIDLPSSLIILTAPTGRSVSLAKRRLATLSSMSRMLVHRCGQAKKTCSLLAWDVLGRTAVSKRNHTRSEVQFLTLRYFIHSKEAIRNAYGHR